MIPLLSLLLSAPSYAGPYDVPLDSKPLYGSNAVEVTWTPNGPRVSIPATTTRSTDFFETEVMPLGRLDESGVWHFTVPTGVQGISWNELMLFPVGNVVQAVITGPNRRSIYTLVYDDGADGPTGPAAPSYNLVLDPKYLVLCEGTTCPKR